MFSFDLLYSLTMGYVLVATLWSVARTALTGRMSTAATIFGIDDVLFWGAVGGGVISWLKGKKQNDAEKAARQMYNQWLQDRSQSAQQIVDNLAANGIDVFGPQTTTSQGSTSGTSAQQFQSTSQTQQSTRPTITPEYAAIEQALRGILQQRLEQPTSLPQGYETGGIRRINDAFEAQLQQERNRLASRNIPAGSVLGSPVERSRASQVADFRINLPLLERQLRNEDINMAGNATAQFGRGQFTEGRTNTRGSQTGQTTSNTFGTVTQPPNLSALANLLLPPAPNASMNTGFSPTLNAGGDLLSALAMLYGGRQGTPGVASGDGYFDDNGNWVPRR